MPQQPGRRPPPPPIGPAVIIIAGLLMMVALAIIANVFLDTATLTPEELAPLEDNPTPNTKAANTPPHPSPPAPKSFPKQESAPEPMDTGEMFACGEIADLEMSAIAIEVPPEAQPKTLAPELIALADQTIERARTRGLLTKDNRLVDNYDERAYGEWLEQCFEGHTLLKQCIEDTFETGNGQLDTSLTYCLFRHPSRAVPDEELMKGDVVVAAEH